MRVGDLEKSVLDTEPVTAPWGVRILRLRGADGFKHRISSVLAERQPPASLP